MSFKIANHDEFMQKLRADLDNLARKLKATSEGGTNHTHVPPEVEGQIVLAPLMDNQRIEGALAALSDVYSMIVPLDQMRLTDVFISCDTMGTAGATIIDVNLNGTTVFTTSARRPQLSYSDADYVERAVPEVQQVYRNDILKVDIDQVATGAKGLVITLLFNAQVEEGTGTGSTPGTPPSGSGYPPVITPIITPPPTGGGTGNTTTCLDDYCSFGPTGPYTGGQNTLLQGSAGGGAYYVQLWFRSPQNHDTSYMTIDGIWQTLVDGVWTNDAWDFSSIWAYDQYYRGIFTGALASALVADGVRTYTFNNTIPYYVKAMGFVPPPTTATYQVGSNLYSDIGIFTVESSLNCTPALTSLTGLNSEHADTAIMTISAEGNVIFDLGFNPDASSRFFIRVGAKVQHVAYWQVYISNDLVDWICPDVFGIGVNNWTTLETRTFGYRYIKLRVYYQSVDSPVAYAYLRDYTYTSQSDRRVQVRSVNFYNVCEGPETTGYPYP